MNRYNRSLFGMNKSETGEWVAYPIFELLQKKCLENDDLAKDRLNIIQERNSTIILKQKEVEESHIKYQKIIDSMNNHNISLEGFVRSKDNTIYNLDEIIKILQSKSKFTDLKHDVFIFSVVLNIALTGFTIINAFGGIL
jgi:hypothetical protein